MTCSRFNPESQDGLSLQFSVGSRPIIIRSLVMMNRCSDIVYYYYFYKTLRASFNMCIKKIKKFFFNFSEFLFLNLIELHDQNSLKVC